MTPEEISNIITERDLEKINDYNKSKIDDLLECFKEQEGAVSEASIIYYNPNQKEHEGYSLAPLPISQFMTLQKEERFKNFIFETVLPDLLESDKDIRIIGIGLVTENQGFTVPKTKMEEVMKLAQKITTEKLREIAEVETIIRFYFNAVDGSEYNKFLVKKVGEHKISNSKGELIDDVTLELVKGDTTDLYTYTKDSVSLRNFKDEDPLSGFFKKHESKEFGSLFSNNIKNILSKEE